jgi:hypothetical protein
MHDEVATQASLVHNPYIVRLYAYLNSRICHVIMELPQPARLIPFSIIRAAKTFPDLDCANACAAKLFPGLESTHLHAPAICGFHAASLPMRTEQHLGILVSHECAD